MTKIKKKILICLLLSILVWSYYLLAYHLPQNEAKNFLNSLKVQISKGEKEIKFSSLINVDFDEVDVIVQVDDSWDEGPVLDFIKGVGYSYTLADVFYLPRILMREYESVFIFTKEKKITEIVRLDTREIGVVDTIYRFNTSQKYSYEYKTGEEFSIEVKRGRELSQDWQNRSGYRYQANITFNIRRKKE